MSKLFVLVFLPLIVVFVFSLTLFVFFFAVAISDVFRTRKRVNDMKKDRSER